MPATLTFTVFSERVLRRLNEANASTLGDLTTGSGGSPTLATTVAIQNYADEAVSILCRTCYPLRGSFTDALSVVQRVTQYQDMTPLSAPTGAILWTALKDGVTWTPNAGTAARLIYCTESALSLSNRNYLVAAPGTPLSWYPLGADQFGVDPAIGNSGTLTVHGLYVAPPGVTSSGTMYPNIPDDILSPYVEAYVAGMLALKNLDDAILSTRAPVWIGTYDDGRSMLLERVDPMTRAYFPAFEPVGGTPQGAATGQGQ